MPLPIGSIRILPIAALIFFLGGESGAFAQSIGPDESPGRDAVAALEGAMAQAPSLTASQKSALYQAARRQGTRAPAIGIEPTVGASVSPAAELSSLPDQAGIDDTAALKYAMVEGDVVVIDPVRMRVVDIIRGSMRP
jgi:hypothetical protein